MAHMPSLDRLRTPTAFVRLTFVALGLLWVIVPSGEVRRLLRICDPQGELPFAEGVDSARARLDRVTRRRQPVSWAG